MPKLVDHAARRSEIAEVACRLVAAHGVGGVTFREVASAAHTSVGSVQHYFGTKEELLRAMLGQTSRRMARRIEDRLSGLGSAPSPADTIRTVMTSFIPDDEDSRAAMTVYHSFAGAALTDPVLRGDEFFENGVALIDFLADQLQDLPIRGKGEPSVNPAARTRALTLLSLVLGLSLAVLLDQCTHDGALASLDEYLRAAEA